MAFHEVRFPDDIAYGATGGPEYLTSVVSMASGYEQRNANWSAARGKWNVASGLKHQAQLNTLIAFFRARKGKAYGFRFKDWTDYKVTDRRSAQGMGRQRPSSSSKAISPAQAAKRARSQSPFWDRCSLSRRR
jgi:uncharacterized protein (TIGR02217 family)